MAPLKLISPSGWGDYELIDTGKGEKLERFGKYILRRPEPQALWEKHLPEIEWEKMCHASFKRDRSLSKDGDKGEWALKPGMPQQWTIQYKKARLAISMRLGLTAFKHVGIFPEQAENWDYIYSTLMRLALPEPKVLNLFAYTGGSSLAAKIAGADVVHVDSVKQVVNWSAENMTLNGLHGIRWVVEDVMKFVHREVKRGKIYHGIVLDPPAYGRGPEGEKWALEDSIDELLYLCDKLLAPQNSFFLLNLYSMGYSALIADNLVRYRFQHFEQFESGELYMADRSGKPLPLGILVRFAR
jgi:23S rRNA (cytosine1962-C5)-methyltransferase